MATALRTLLFAVLVALASGLVERLVAASFDPFQPYPGHRSDYGVARARAIRAALPSIAQTPEATALVLGSSGMARAFVPSVFDAALGDAPPPRVSFNLAQLLLQPETSLAMARVIRSEYEARHKRIDIAVFGISVPELTSGALGAARRRMPDQAFVFSTGRTLIGRARRSPVHALGDAVELLLYGDVRPERVGSWLEDRLAGLPPPCESGMKQPPVGKEALEALTAFCSELRAQFPTGVPPWNPRSRGAFDFGLPQTRPMLDRLIELQEESPTTPPPSSSPSPRADSGSSPNGAGSVVDADAVAMLVEAAHEIAAVTRHLFILRDIMNPAMLQTLPRAQLVAWHDVAEKIARADDAPLLDFNDGTFAPSDFGDRTHLNPLAAERFSTLLAARLRPFLQEDRASR